MSIFPAETLGLPSYESRFVRLDSPVTPAEPTVFDDSSRAYGRDVLYHYEREHL